MLNIEEFNNKYSYNQATPMMRQYLDLKFQHQDCLLLFRMGDFYELFFEDALLASEILGIALAKRGQHAGEDLAMCGVPFHALNSYINKLIDSNYKIAICEQLESPEEAKKRDGYKAVVKRDIVRIITPGTVYEEGSINLSAPNYLAAVCINNDIASIAYIDISTLEFFVTKCHLNKISGELEKISPKELLLSEKIQLNSDLLANFSQIKGRLVYQVDSYFDAKKAMRKILSFYNMQSIESLGEISNIEISAIGAVLEYISITQRVDSLSIPYPKIINLDQLLYIDGATRKSLELTRTLKGEYKGSLISVLDHTITRAGARLLHNYISAPTTNIKVINKRLDIVEFFIQNEEVAQFIRKHLSTAGDLERLLSKVSLKRANPNDLLAIARTIKTACKIKEYIAKHIGMTPPSWLEKIYDNLGQEYTLATDILQALKDEVPNSVDEGGFIRPEFDPKIAELHRLLNNSNQLLEDLRLKYQKETGIDNIKINNNNIVGLYIEVTKRHADKITDPKFQHRQTLLNGVRYKTDELIELELELTTAHNQLAALERQIFDNLCLQISRSDTGLRLLSYYLALLDVFTNFAFIAKEYNYCRPELVETKELDIKLGRHAVVEHTLSKSRIKFTANDANLNELDRLVWLITGPNMAGKSTFLRQNALIVIMAQAGCFIPASSAKIGIVDKIFSRIGSGDDLSAGQSTFMVEMIETSSILSQSTDRSLIILDEVGRGTSTFDGMSIAWACLEYIHNNLKCRCLFATHYHELTALSSSLPKMKCYTIDIREENEKLLFLHKIIEGCADKSYGIHVAEIAGLPKSVIARAKEVLKSIENNEKIEVKRTSPALETLNLFAYKPQNAEDGKQNQELKAKLERITSILNHIDINNMTPFEAMLKLKELKDKTKEDIPA